VLVGFDPSLDRTSADTGFFRKGNRPFSGALLPEQSFPLAMFQSGTVYEIADDAESERRNLHFFIFIHKNPPF
jgi:hypothetical protein